MSECVRECVCGLIFLSQTSYILVGQNNVKDVVCVFTKLPSRPIQPIRRNVCLLFFLPSPGNPDSHLNEDFW